MSTPIKRYAASVQRNVAGFHVHLKSRPNGEVVFYADHAAHVAQLNQEAGELETAIILADPQFDANSTHETPHARLIDSVKRLADRLKASDLTGIDAASFWLPSKEAQDQAIWQRYFDHYLLVGTNDAENSAKLADKAVAQLRARCEKKADSPTASPTPNPAQPAESPYVPKAGDRVVYTYRESQFHGHIEDEEGTQSFVCSIWSDYIGNLTGTFRLETEADRKARA